MKEWILKICAEGGYDIGFTATGEWMKYNVNVTQAGTYTLQVRVATPNSNDSLHVEIDNVVVSGKIIVTNTGGYQNWQTVSVTTSALTVGTHIMRIYFATGGFNLEYLNFVYGTPLAAPSITSSTSVSSFIGSAFTYTTTASNNPASYSATNLPAGLSINTTTGVISGIAASMGTANVTINATNATGTGTAALSLTFNASTTESAYGGIIQIIPGEIIAANFDNGGQM
ncbi:MAG: carbohydrate-binding domain-containing protein [Ferruginibacter sp.]